MLSNEWSDNNCLQQQQFAFTAYVRDPENNLPPADIEQERMMLYRELFFNNIVDTLSSAFPVMHQVLDQSYWQFLCQDFFANQRCKTPYLSHLPGEFVEYLQATGPHQQPWLNELAVWEWTELELFLAPDPELPEQLGHDVLNNIPVLSPLVRLHAFHYPVHHISADNCSAAVDQVMTYLLAWRKPDDSIGFMEANSISARLLQLISENDQYSGYELLQLIATEDTVYGADAILAGGIEVLNNFLNNKILLGGLPVKPMGTRT